MLCNEIMKTDVVSIAPGDTVQEAATKMHNRNVGFLPVCEARRKVIGTLTDRDIVVRHVAQGGDPDAPVSSIMSELVVSCQPATDVHNALELMRLHQVSRLMCVDDSDRLVGVISLSDIAQNVGDLESGATLRAVSAREAHP